MKVNNLTKQATKRKGFTLIELLVSMTVTMIIIAVLMAMTRVAVNGMQASQNATRYSQFSQEVMTILSKDLEGIVIRTGNNYEWVKVSQSSNSEDELGPNKDKQMQNPIELNFFSAVTDRYDGQIGTNDDKGGDISLIRYKLVYQDVISGGTGGYPVFSLYRKRVNPDVTFENFLAKEDIENFAGNVTGDDFLAENIYDLTISFNFEFIKADGSSSYKRIPVQIGGTYRSLTIKGNEVLVNGDPLVLADASAPRLVSADVSILVLSDAGMNGLKRAKIGSTTELSAYLRKHSKTFSKSVVLPRP